MVLFKMFYYMNQREITETVKQYLELDEKVVSFLFCYRPLFFWLSLFKILFLFLPGLQFYLVFTDKKIIKININLIGKPTERELFSYDDLSSYNLERGFMKNLRLNFRNGRTIGAKIPFRGLLKHQLEQINISEKILSEVGK